MAKFFIDRPIFAWVIALFIMVLGAVSITQLPIAQYPPVAPPSIVINATYPGASAKTLEDSVLSVIEQEMNGSPGLIYMEAVAQANGTGSITLSFEPGSNADLAQVDVQNRLSRATPRLPSAVTQQGVRVDKSRSNFLLFAILSSDDPALDPVALGDYASRSVVPELQRLPGVGQAQLFGTERAMRIWIDPAKLLGFNLSAADVTNAIRAQNAQVSAGEIGALPNVGGQSIAATVVVNGQLATVEQFGNIVLRADDYSGGGAALKPGRNFIPMTAYKSSVVSFDFEGNHPPAASIQPPRSPYHLNKGGVGYRRITVNKTLTVLGRLIDPQGRPLKGHHVINHASRGVSEVDGFFSMEMQAGSPTLEVRHGEQLLCQFRLDTANARKEDNVLMIGDLRCSADTLADATHSDASAG